MVKSGFFGGYSCDWCDAKFNSKKTAGEHELDCEMSPSNLQKEVRKLRELEQVNRIKYAFELKEKGNLSDLQKAYDIFNEEGHSIELANTSIEMAREKERLLDYEGAIDLFEKANLHDDAKRVRKLRAEQGAVKVDQTVVQGDQITKTEIKDSVLNRSNVVGGGSSKMQELKDLAEMKEKGLISDEEYEKMKREIIG